MSSVKRVILNITSGMSFINRHLKFLGRNEDTFLKDEEEGFLRKGLVQGRWCIADEKPVTMKQVFDDDIHPTSEEFEYLDELDTKICTESYSMSVGKSFSFTGPENMNR